MNRRGSIDCYYDAQLGVRIPQNKDHVNLAIVPIKFKYREDWESALSEDELCTEIKQKTEETQSAKKNMSDAHIKELLGVLASKGIIDVGMITACSVEK